MTPTAALASDSARHLPAYLNYTALGSVSSGFTMGAIRGAVVATLTPSRVVDALKGEGESGRALLREEEFLGALAAFPIVAPEAMDRLRDFQDHVLGYEKARTVVDPNAGAAPKKGK